MLSRENISKNIEILDDTKIASYGYINYTSSTYILFKHPKNIHKIKHILVHKVSCKTISIYVTEYIRVGNPSTKATNKLVKTVGINVS